MNRRGPMGPLHPGIHNETGGAKGQNGGTELYTNGH